MKINDLTDEVCRAFKEKAGELAKEELDLARFICNKLGIRLNLSEDREIVRKLEDAGIIKEGRFQAEKVLLKEGDQRNPRALGESERPDVIQTESRKQAHRCYGVRAEGRHKKSRIKQGTTSGSKAADS